MCAKFRENQTKTVGGVAIWKVWWHTSTQTDHQSSILSAPLAASEQRS